MFFPIRSDAQVAGGVSSAADSGGIQKRTEQRSWLGGLFDRYLRAKKPLATGLRGKARISSARFVSYQGWTIEVVLVNQVETFDQDWNEGLGLGKRVFNSLTHPLQCNTCDGTIRRYLLFKQGQILDPFALADSEMLLRSLSYIDDVRITVIPLAGAAKSVAVVVETRDSWPIGVDAKAINQNRYNVSLYSDNLLGRGLAMSHELVHNANSKYSWGYHGLFRYPNLMGKFIDLGFDFEDSWRRLSRSLDLEKRLVHPAVRLVGGGRLELTDDRDNQDTPRKFTEGDVWLGRALSLDRTSSRAGTSRLLLVPTVGYRGISFRARPDVSLSENRIYHNRHLLLAGCSLLRIKNYKTNYFYKMGETEDIRAGWDAQVTAAYEDGEFENRSASWLQGGRVSVNERGRILALMVGGGGYWHHGDFEEGVLEASGFYATRLFEHGSFGQRWYFRGHYTRGYARFATERISLGNNSGLRGLDDGVLLGRQRLVGTVESRLFTPWTLFGFRCLLLGFVDAGVIADQNASLGGRPVLLSMGMGARLDNPGLVLPPLQVRIGVRDRARDRGMVIELVFGGSRQGTGITFPGVKPEPMAFR